MGEENSMYKTVGDLCRAYFPGVHDDLIDAILWGATAYPFNDEDGLSEQLRRVRWKMLQGREILLEADTEMSWQMAWCNRCDEAGRIADPSGPGQGAYYAQCGIACYSTNSIEHRESVIWRDEASCAPA